MNKYKTGMVWTLFFIFFFTYAVYTQAYSHESSHESICKYFNGETDKIEINLIKGKAFVNCSNITDEVWNSFLIAQSMVDANYSRENDFIMLLIFGYVFGLLLILKENEVV